MKKVFISMGLGVQTTAVAILAYQGKIKADEMIFSDTGLEKPETYEHMEKRIKPLAKEMGMPFTTVSMDREVDEIGENGEPTGKKVRCRSLKELIEARKRVPSLMNRWCTEKSKITPIKLYLREQQSEGTYEKPASGIIGISTDEKHRAHQPHHSEYASVFPLLDLGISRRDCEIIIKEFGWDLPVKSGCYLCPFQGGREWDRLFYDHNDLYLEAQRIEEMDLRYPTYRLYPRMTLKKFSEPRKLGRYNLSLFDDYEGDDCSGGCML